MEEHNNPLMLFFAFQTATAEVSPVVVVVLPPSPGAGKKATRKERIS
jgi:hypothetical protein